MSDNPFNDINTWISPQRKFHDEISDRFSSGYDAALTESEDLLEWMQRIDNAVKVGQEYTKSAGTVMYSADQYVGVIKINLKDNDAAKSYLAKVEADAAAIRSEFNASRRDVITKVDKLKLLREKLTHQYLVNEGIIKGDKK